MMHTFYLHSGFMHFYIQAKSLEAAAEEASRLSGFDGEFFAPYDGVSLSVYWMLLEPFARIVNTFEKKNDEIVDFLDKSGKRHRMRIDFEDDTIFLSGYIRDIPNTANRVAYAYCGSPGRTCCAKIALLEPVYDKSGAIYSALKLNVNSDDTFGEPETLSHWDE